MVNGDILPLFCGGSTHFGGVPPHFTPVLWWNLTFWWCSTTFYPYYLMKSLILVEHHKNTHFQHILPLFCGGIPHFGGVPPHFTPVLWWNPTFWRWNPTTFYPCFVVESPQFKTHASTKHERIGCPLMEIHYNTLYTIPWYLMAKENYLGKAGDADSVIYLDDDSFCVPQADCVIYACSCLSFSNVMI